MAFADRRDAGRQLGERVAQLDLQDPVVIGLPRGGVPVAAEVARALQAPLDVLVVRKLGSPWQPELGVGAIAEGGVRLVNQELADALDLSAADIDAIAADEQPELERRVRRYRGDRPRVGLDGRTVVLVDDGLATGISARTAVAALREAGVARLVLAVPVASPDVAQEFRQLVDDLVCLQTPRLFRAVGAHYKDFEQTSDTEVQSLLAEKAAGEQSPGSAEASAELAAGTHGLPGTLRVPQDAMGLVVFVHGSGSGRFSPRNTAVARRLNAAGLGTFLFDLLTPDETADRSGVFDIPLLASRLVDVTRWLASRPEARGLPVGYFGASTGAAAALQASVDPDVRVGAVVSRGGRPDLAPEALGRVRAPTLLIVGGGDTQVLELNRQAARALECEHAVEVVPGATHLFEEPGALDTVARRAAEWFVRHLAGQRA